MAHSAEYTNESQITAALMDSLSLLFPEWKSMAIARELPVGHRWVDVVVMPIKAGFPSEVLRSNTHRIRNVNARQFHVLAMMMAKGDASIHYLNQVTGLEPACLREQYIEPLVDAGLVDRVSRYRYSPSRMLLDWSTQLIAIESKLSRWAEALEQAKWNLRFADMSFVALSPSTAEVALSHRDLFEQSGIGIISVRGRSTTEVVLYPRVLSPSKRAESGAYQCLQALRDLVCGGSKWAITRGIEHGSE